MKARLKLKDIKNQGLRRAVEQEGSVWKVSQVVGMHPQNVYLVARSKSIPPLLAIRLFQVYKLSWKELGYDRSGRTGTATS